MPVRPLATAMIVVALLAVFAAIRLRVADFPLERDEGEYAYAGQLLRQGVPPYLLAYNMKWPGTYVAYAVLMSVFGETIRGLRMGILLVTSLSAIGMFLLGARLFGRIAGFAALGAQLAFSVSVASLGLFGHATHFVVLFAVAGFLALSWAPERPFSAPQLLIAGALFAIAALMKQPGAAFGLCALAYVLDPWSQRPGSRPVRNAALLSLGAVVPATLCALTLLRAGVFRRFWFWTVDYARHYASQTPLDVSLHELARTSGAIFRAAPALWLVVPIGGVLLLLDREARKSWRLTAALVVGGVFATIPGLHFREHYFLAFFPGASLLVGVAVACVERRLSALSLPAVTRFAPVALFALILGAAAIHEWRELGSADTIALSRRIYKANPFPESIEVARYIAERTSPSDAIAVVGSEPQIYFYAARRSATGYIYTYALMEPQPFASRMQREMIDEISRSKPRYIVFVNVRTSWLQRPDSDRMIFDWAGTLAHGEYVLDGVVEIFRDSSHYAWGADAATEPLEALNYLVVLKKRA